MRNKFLFVSLLFSCSMIAACGLVKVPKIANPFGAPEYRPTKIEHDNSAVRETVKKIDVELGRISCEKPESKQIIPESAKPTVVIKSRVETRRHEYVDCDGKVTMTKDRPVEYVIKTVAVLPPDSVKEKVTFVRLKTFRTCLDFYESSIADGKLKLKNAPSDGEVLEDRQSKATELGESGLMGLTVTDLDVTGLSLVNTLDGKNLITIEYWSCQKFKANGDEPSTDPNDCIEKQLLGFRQLVIDLQIERPKSDKVERVDACMKK